MLSFFKIHIVHDSRRVTLRKPARPYINSIFSNMSNTKFTFGSGTGSTNTAASGTSAGTQKSGTGTGFGLGSTSTSSGGSGFSFGSTSTSGTGGGFGKTSFGAGSGFGSSSFGSGAFGQNNAITVDENKKISELPKEAIRHFLACHEAIGKFETPRSVTSGEASTDSLDQLKNSAQSAVTQSLFQLAREVDSGESSLDDYRWKLEQSKEHLRVKTHKFPHPVFEEHVKEIERRQKEIEDALNRLVTSEKEDVHIEPLAQAVGEVLLSTARCAAGMYEYREKFQSLVNRLNKAELRKEFSRAKEVDMELLAEIKAAYEGYYDERERDRSKRETDPTRFQQPAQTSGFGGFGNKTGTGSTGFGSFTGFGNKTGTTGSTGFGTGAGGFGTPKAGGAVTPTTGGSSGFGFGAGTTPGGK